MYLALIIAGANNIKWPEVFIPTTGQHCLLPDLPDRRYGHSLSQKTICGGSTSDNTSTYCITLTDDLTSWEKTTELQNPRLLSVHVHTMKGIIHNHNHKWCMCSDLSKEGWDRYFHKKESIKVENFHKISPQTPLPPTPPHQGKKIFFALLDKLDHFRIKIKSAMVTSDFWAKSLSRAYQ